MSKMSERFDVFLNNQKAVALVGILFISGLAMVIYATKFADQKQIAQAEQVNSADDMNIDNLIVKEKDSTVFNSKTDAINKGGNTWEDEANDPNHTSEFESSLNDNVNLTEDNVLDDIWSDNEKNHSNDNVNKSNEPISKNQGASTIRSEKELKQGFDKNEAEQPYVEEAIEPVKTNTQTDNTRRRNVGESNSNMGYGFSSGQPENTQDIAAVVHNGGRNVSSGSRVTLRLTENAVLDGIDVPKNTMLFGLASISSDRLKIRIKSYKMNKQVFYCKLAVFELDGIEGIYVPEGMLDDVAQEGKQDGINKSSTTLSIPVIGSITTNALTKRNKDNSVVLNDGHKVILRSDKK